MEEKFPNCLFQPVKKVSTALASGSQNQEI